jgi:membrane-associated phospholipid phosphatase
MSIRGSAVPSPLLALRLELARCRRFDSELNNLNRSLLNPLDRWALDVQTADVAQVETFSNITQGISAAIPLSLLFMNRIKDDWGHVLLMYAEATSVTIALYVASPLGPQFQNRFRPSAYDTAQSIASRQDGNKRNSFYSGHVATASVATFFFAKVYTDYHPELGNDKYWFYAAAMVPPLIMGYFRIKAHDHFPSDVLTGLGIGALCGILIPELHRITCNNLNFGAYATPDGNKGLTFQWSPGLASK